MKILYIANMRLPTEKAHGIQIMKTCEAFADLGHEVELAVPWRFNFIKKDPFEYYGTRKNFKITKLPSLDTLLFTSGKVGFLIQSFSFSVSAFFCVLFKKNNIIYSRDELPLFLLSFFKKNLFWESHTGRFNFIIKKVLKKCAGLVMITKGLQDFYAKKGDKPSKVLIAPDGVDVNEFSVDLSKEECRRRFNFPQDKKIIMYAGHLYDWKGADVLLEAAGTLKDCLFVFVGGTAVDIKNFKSKAEKLNFKNILILGHKPHREIPYYLKAADVLVLPNRGDSEISAKYTSPMKLFEYMAASRPIVASDLPSIREILNEGNSVLVESDNPLVLVAGIKKVLEDKESVKKLTLKAKEDVNNYVWDKRAQKIIEFLITKL